MTRRAADADHDVARRRGQVDITPKPSDLAIATASIRDPLFARAIVVDNGADCAVLVGLDLGAASSQMVADAVSRASAATRCAAEHFIISATTPTARTRRDWDKDQRCEQLALLRIGFEPESTVIANA